MKLNRCLLSLVLLSAPCVVPAQAAEKVAIAPLVKTINSVERKAVGHREAMEAWSQLANADADRIPEILAGFDDSNRLAANWLRAAVESIAGRQSGAGGSLPLAELEGFLADTSQSPKARRVAYELIRSTDADAADRLIPSFLNDPSMELRRDGVSHALDKAEEVLAADDKEAAIDAYQTALNAARDLDQVKAATVKLRELGQTVDLPTHFGFITDWKLIGPFDNTDKSGFDVAYGPETDPNLSATYPGKVGTVKWIDHTTDDEYGMVDLNKAIGKHMGAIAYAFAEFYSDRPRDIELRLGSICANKVWLNGELLFSNHVYHAGTSIDQYTGSGRLQEGKNVILVKIAQNEQTEDWAQDWNFQLRVCDQYGTAVLSD